MSDREQALLEAAQVATDMRLDAERELAVARAQLAEARRLLTEASAFIGKHGVDVLAYEQGENNAVRAAEAAESRLARLRPLVRAAAEWWDGYYLTNVDGTLLSCVEQLSPADRAWALGTDDQQEADHDRR